MPVANAGVANGVGVGINWMVAGVLAVVATAVVELAVAEGVAIGTGVGAGELTATLDGPGVPVGAGFARRAEFGSGSVPGLGVGVRIGTAAD